MTDSNLRPAGVAWGHVARWFLRGRVFRIAVQVRMLALASVGVLLTIFGWWLIAQAYSSAVSPEFAALLPSYRSCPWTSVDSRGGLLSAFGPTTSTGPDMGAPPTDGVIDPWHRLTTPVVQFFHLSRSAAGASFLVLCTLWATLVWGLFGGALTRSAMLQLSREESAPLGAALGHAGRRWISYSAAPLLPLAAVLFITLGLLFLGLVMRASVLLAGIAWPLALLGGAVMALAALGLSVGWPLMHATISAEGSDGFDAISRSYSYVYQRPLHYLFYGLCALVLGLIGLFVVELFATTVIHLSHWSVSWGSGNELMRRVVDRDPSLGRTDLWGAELIRFWVGAVRLMVVGFAFAFFWTAVSAVYLLLRFDADGAELNEIHVDEGDQTYGLPPLTKDAAGVPVVPAGAASADTAPPANG